MKICIAAFLSTSLLCALSLMLIHFVVPHFQNIRVLFNIRVVAGPGFYNYLSPEDQLPLYHPAVEG